MLPLRSTKVRFSPVSWNVFSHDGFGVWRSVCATYSFIGLFTVTVNTRSYLTESLFEVSMYERP